MSEEQDSEQNLDTVELATDLTIAWLGNHNNQVAADEVPAFLRAVHGTLTELASTSGAAAAEPAEEYTPAVSVRKSLASKDHIISMIDGKPYKALRRHLTSHGLTADEYRRRYNLKPDYPMVAETYSAQRRAMAKKIGLGRKPAARKPNSNAKPKTTTGRRRKAKSA